MPRPRPRGTVSQLPPIDLALVDMLLDGLTRPPAAIQELEAAGVTYDWCLEFEPHSVFRAAWRQHRTWLLAEYARRGGTGVPWGAQFDHPETE